VNDRDTRTTSVESSKLTGRRGSSKTDLVYARLKDDIVAGRLDPGVPISERALADEYAVSRVPVREALIRLERDGLVQTWPGRGAAVKVLSAEQMRSVYLAREAIEGMAARLAAERGRGDAFSSIRQRLEEELGREHADKNVLSGIGDDLHAAVLAASRNSVLVEMAATIADRVKIGRRLSYGETVAGSLHLEAAREHLNVAEAIDGGDPDAAEQAMRSHIAAWAGHLNTQILGDHPL
jgi:DNA-binding GntR family transcriptional regulator